MIEVAKASEISWPISTKFHVDPTVETGLRVCSNGHSSLTVMPIHGKIMITKKQKKTHTSSSKPRTAQMMILLLVAMIGLGKCCITTAYLQWIFHLGERAMVHGPLVFFFYVCFFRTGELKMSKSS